MNANNVNAFIQSKLISENSVPWERDVTGDPDTGANGSSSSESGSQTCTPSDSGYDHTPREIEQKYGQDSTLLMNLNEDFDWKRCITGDSCNELWHGGGDEYEQQQNQQQQQHQLMYYVTPCGDATGGNDAATPGAYVMMPVFIPVCQYPTQVTTPQAYLEGINGSGEAGDNAKPWESESATKDLQIDRLHRFNSSKKWQNCGGGKATGKQQQQQQQHQQQQQPPWLPSRGNSSNNMAGKGGDAHLWNEGVTTVMIRNLHNKVTQQSAVDDFKANGFEAEQGFDFFYLPIDADTKANRGYCFVNFVDTEIARKFKECYEDGQIGENKASKSGKFLKVVPATLQGFAANYVHYDCARVQRGSLECRPLFTRQPTAAEMESLSLLESSRRGGANGELKVKKGRGRRSLIDVAAQEQHPTTVEYKVEKLDRFCHQCGGKAGSSFKYCTFCGAEVIRDLQ
jgi:hypothetical protein